MIDPTEVQKEYELILKKISDPGLISNGEKFEILNQRKKFLEQIIQKNNEVKNIRKQIEENKTIENAKEDPQLAVLAQEEIIQLKEREKVLEKEIQKLLGGDENVTTDISQAIIAEIRAGTGGEEAALFAKDLFQMYSKFAKSQNWKEKILDLSLSDLGGFKTVIFELSDGNIFSQMKYEGGVHRIQRIPVTEKLGRVHTSTATVAILPKPKKAKIKTNPKDLRIDFYRASGPGGQYVNKRETAVRITHLPTGITVSSQTERNQLQNKENAMAILEAKVWEAREREAEEKIHGKRKAQIGWAKRAEKTRTNIILQI